MSSAEAKNLEAISKAIDQHNASCPFPAAEVRMNPFEIERLGWEEIRGLPLVGDPEIGTGRFRIVCSRELGGGELEEVEAVGEELETRDPAAQTWFQKSSPRPLSQLCASMLRRKNSPVRISTPVAIRMAPPTPMITP